MLRRRRCIEGGCVFRSHPQGGKFGFQTNEPKEPWPRMRARLFLRPVLSQQVGMEGRPGRATEAWPSLRI